MSMATHGQNVSRCEVVAGPEDELPSAEVGASPGRRSRCKTIALLLIQQAADLRREAW